MSTVTKGFLICFILLLDELFEIMLLDQISYSDNSWKSDLWKGCIRKSYFYDLLMIENKYH